MKKKVLSLLLAMTMSMGLLCGCGQSDVSKNAQEENVQEENLQEENLQEENAQQGTAKETEQETANGTETKETDEDALSDDVVIRVASLKVRHPSVLSNCGRMLRKIKPMLTMNLRWQQQRMKSFLLC